MREEVHFHQKVVGNLSLGRLSTYLLQVFFLGGVQLILNRGSTKLQIQTRLSTRLDQPETTLLPSLTTTSNKLPASSDRGSRPSQSEKYGMGWLFIYD